MGNTNFEVMYLDSSGALTVFCALKAQKEVFNSGNAQAYKGLQPASSSILLALRSFR